MLRYVLCVYRVLHGIYTTGDRMYAGLGEKIIDLSSIEKKIVSLYRKL